MKNKNSSIVLFISLIVTAGFVLSAVSSVLSFQSLFKKDIESVSQLTSENIYVSINDLMDGPINVSIAMAHDTLLRDFMEEEPADGLRGEQEDTLTEYLASYQKKYQFDSVFLASTRTGAYYHYKNGIDRIMTQDNPENEWYYRFLQTGMDCTLNVDNDEAKDDIVTIFVNCRLKDGAGNTLGVVGVGMETPYLQQFLMENEREYGVRAYLIDEAGNIQISSELTEFEQVNLFENERFADMKGALTLRQDTQDQRWYHTREADGYRITRYIPNLNWYLVVEKSTEEFTWKMVAQLGLNLLFLLVVVSVVIVVIVYVLKKYDRRLVAFAEADQLTGVRNRTSYERELFQCAARLDTYRSFGIGIFDLNDLKTINDRYGHQTGDEYIRMFATALCAIFDHCPVFRIGGDEFAVIFADMDRDEVERRIAELVLRCERSAGQGMPPVSAAFGCAFRENGTLHTVEEIFKAADDDMYCNKRCQKRS